MKFILLVYNDESVLDSLSTSGAFDPMMKECFDHADELRTEGRLLQSQQLEPAATAKTVRMRGGRMTAVDGPFAETKEVLGGFNIIEAADIDEAVRIAASFPWAGTGSIEVRPVRDIDSVRQRVGAAADPAAKETVGG